MKTYIPPEATYKEVLSDYYSYAVNDKFPGGVLGCPHDWFIDNDDFSLSINCLDSNCRDCWNQIYKGEKIVAKPPFTKEEAKKILNDAFGANSKYIEIPAYETVRTNFYLPKNNGSYGTSDLQEFFDVVHSSPNRFIIIPIDWKLLHYVSIDSCYRSFRQSIDLFYETNLDKKRTLKIVRHMNNLYLIKQRGGLIPYV